jgi:hypothetical protein
VRENCGKRNLCPGSRPYARIRYDTIGCPERAESLHTSGLPPVTYVENVALRAVNGLLWPFVTEFAPGTGTEAGSRHPVVSLPVPLL